METFPKKNRSYRLVREQRGGILVEALLLISLIAVLCISAISGLTKGGIMMAFCKLMHAEPDGQVLIDAGIYNLETGECFDETGANPWDFDWYL